MIGLMRFSSWYLSLPLVAAAALSACDGSECEGDCVCRGTECQCPDSGDCRVDCAADCNLACTGSGDCDFACGDGCVATCPGSGFCAVEVGVAGSVDCTGSGNCNVVCHGDCTVGCPGSGDCTVRCAEGATCNLDRCSGTITECPDRVQVCGGGCP
jgi:hypothetical protein